MQYSICNLYNTAISLESTSHALLFFVITPEALAVRRCGFAACGRFYHAACIDRTEEDMQAAFLW